MKEDIFSINTEKDLPNVRYLQLYGNRIIFKRQEPFGFWTIHFERGAIPKSLSGNWLSVEQAKIAAERYIRSKGRGIPAQQEV